MVDQASARSVLRKIIITVIVGIVSFPITDLIFPSLPAQLAMAVGFGSIVLLIQFLIDFEVRLARVEAGQIDTTVDMRHAVARGFSNVNEATRLFARAEAIGLKDDAVTRLVQSATEITAGSPRLVTSFALSEIDRVSEFLRGLATREATYGGEDQDWLLGLTRNVTESIDAISLPAVDAAGNIFRGFWDSDLGRRYLNLQREAIQRRGIKVRRVFVAENDEVTAGSNLLRICSIQAEAGIDVRLIYPSAIPFAIRISLFDFILFDNTISYELTPAAQVAEGENPMILFTRLVTDTDRVAERIQRYERIWESAAEWDTRSIEASPSLTSSEARPEP